MITTWGIELKREFLVRGEDFNSMICTLSGDELNKEFDSGYGGAEGNPFTAWGPNYVYFPVVYDGAEWVESAPRNPCKEATSHQGGQ